MILQFVLSVFLCFCLLISLMVFYLRYKSKMPYYRLSQNDCTVLLDKAVNGILLEYDWNVFIGMTIRDDEQFEHLREACLLIDEEHKKGAQLIDGKLYVRFSKAGLKQLSSLLDEWRHKVHYAA